jgi:hypothetical protein
MKNKYNTYTYNDYVNYVDINDYIKEYVDWTTYDPETKEERLAREKAEKRNDKIDQILGNQL